MALKKIGKYQIIGKIGTGGMGAVYKARHPTLKRLVILKQLTLRGSASLIERFKREARIMLDLRNDNIVQVYDHFKEGNFYYIAMEYVDGIALDRLIHNRRYLSNEAAILIFTEVCKGLKYAHDRHIIHRDIKPANILISKEGEVKITDFGIATSKEDESYGLTRAGTTLGTPAYMPPEQIINSKNVDKRADIYAMGVMLYNMVTGKLPFPTNITPNTIARIEKGKFVSPKEINPKISLNILKVIKKSIRPKRKKRFRDLSIVLSKFKFNLVRFKESKSINHAIKNYINGKEISSKRLGKRINLKSLLPVKSKGLFLFLLILIIIGLAGYNLGFMHELLLKNQYGAMKVIIESQKGINLKNRDINITTFYRNKDGKFIKSNFIYYWFSKKGNNKKNFFESQKIYLKSNQYYLDINIKNKRYYYNFLLNSRTEQKKLISTRENERIQINYIESPSFPLRINFNFQDMNNNREINSVDIKFLYNSDWYDWNSFIKKNSGLIRSGKTYYFLFTKNGYLQNKYQFDVDPYQTDLTLDIKMIQAPGILKINMNESTLNLLLNNSKYYLSGGNNSKYIRIQPSIIQYLLFKTVYNFIDKKSKNYKDLKNSIYGEKNLILYPGQYTLKVKKFSFFSKITDSQILNIIPNGMVTFNIKYDKKNKNLKIY